MITNDDVRHLEEPHTEGQTLDGARGRYHNIQTISAWKAARGHLDLVDGSLGGPVVLPSFGGGQVEGLGLAF